MPRVLLSVRWEWATRATPPPGGRWSPHMSRQSSPRARSAGLRWGVRRGRPALDDAARDPVARVPRRVGAIVVLGRMEDERRPVAVEQASGFPLLERHALREELDFDLAVGGHDHVREVA